MSFYLGETRGNGRRAAQLAGYRGKPEVLDVQAARLLRRARVQHAIQLHLETEGKRAGLSKDRLAQLVYEVMAEGRPFERLKAAELLGKLMGWFAPTQQVARNQPAPVGSEVYSVLADSLERHGATFSAEERETIRQDLVGVTAQARRALKALDSATGS